MFGYVRAVTAVLPPEEQARYRAVYCGLCKTLGERYGKAAQLTLNYDFVFLALLLAPPEGEEEKALFRCPAAPWKKKPVWPGDAALEAAADATVILVWWKLQDAIRDGGAGEKLKSRSAALALRRSYRAAAQRRPDFDRVVETCLEELHQLEEANTPSLDRPADAFARLLQAAAIAVSPAARQSAVAQILYHVGRWIYLADAWDDLAEDREAGNYNPLLARYGDQAEQHQAALRETMHISLGLANTAYALLDWGVWEPLLGHILTIGLPAVEEAVFTGQWKQAKHPRLFQRDQAPALPAGETDKENKKL